MKRLIATAVIGLALAGCAPTMWHRPGATQQDYYRDAYECERESMGLKGGYVAVGPNAAGQIATAHLLDAIAMSGMQYRCMQAKGWREVVQPVK